MPFKGDFITKNINDTWAMLTEDLHFYSDWYDEDYTVGHGFVTDFASVPRLPLIYMWCGGRGKRAATVHDDGYSKQAMKKRKVDLLFLEGMIDTFVHDAVTEFVKEENSFKQYLCFFKIVWRYFLAIFMYVGVVFGGWGTWLRYKSRRKKGLPLRPDAPQACDDRWEDRVF
jgi:hypothetical protein